MSSIHLPAFDPQTLISGGGDPTLKLWDWMNGKVKAEVQIQDIVQRFIKVRAAKKGRAGQDVGDENKRKRKTGKGKGKEPDLRDEEDVDGKDADESPSLKDVRSAEEQGHTTDDYGQLVQVVHKIDSFETETKRYLLFSVVGFVSFITSTSPPTDVSFYSATALFLSLFPLDASSDIRVRHFDFGRPVLDFISRSDGVFWVLLDGEWDGVVEERMVQVVRWDSNANEVDVFGFIWWKN